MTRKTPEDLGLAGVTDRDRQRPAVGEVQQNPLPLVLCELDGEAGTPAVRQRGVPDGEHARARRLIGQKEDRSRAAPPAHRAHRDALVRDGDPDRHVRPRVRGLRTGRSARYQGQERQQKRRVGAQTTSRARLAGVWGPDWRV